jgi:hypothetical protein
MLNHLRKDLRMTRAFWAPMVFSYGAFMLVFFESPWAFLAAGLILTFIMAAVPMAIDDRYRTDPLFAGLPGRRTGLVAGRYLSWGFAVMAGLILYLGAAALLLLAIKSKAAHLVPLLSMRRGLAFLVASALAALAFLPLYFRFGFWKGLWIFAAGAVCLGAAFSFLAPVLAPPQGGETAGAATGGALAPAVQALIRIAGEAARFPRNTASCLGTTAGLLLLAFVSFRLSLAFYEKRDL